MPAAEPPVLEQQPQSWLDFLIDTVAPKAAYAYQWTQVGPHPLQNSSLNKVSGRAFSLAVDPASNTQRILQGGVGGLWRTSNGGAGWTALTDNEQYMVRRLAVHRDTTTNVVTVLAGSDSAADDLSAGVPLKALGILRSANAWTDPISSWARIGPPNTPGGLNSQSTEAILDLKLDTTQPQPRLWAVTSTLGLPYALWWSENFLTAAPDSVTWQRVTLPSELTQFKFLLVSPYYCPPTNTGRLYLKSVSASTGYAWYRSSNRGNTWTNIGSGGGDFTVGDPVIAPCMNGSCTNCQTATDTIYELRTNGSGLCVTTPTQRTLWKTSDSGATWQHVTSADCAFIGSPAQDTLAIHPSNPGIVAVGFVDIYRSVNNGPFERVTFWNDPTDVHADHGALLFAPDAANPNRLIDGNDGGVWSTNDFLASLPSWTNRNDAISTILFYTGDIDTLNYGVSWGASQDNGLMKGGTPLLWRRVLNLGDATRILVDPTNSNCIYYTGSFSGTPEFSKSTDGGYSRGPDLMNPPPTPGTITIDPSDRNTVIAVSGQDIYRTLNGGSSWASLATLGTGFGATAIAPTAAAPSSIILAGGCGMVKRTTNANGPSAPTWTTHGLGTFPSRCIKDFVCNQKVPCTSSQGIIYAAFDGFEQNLNPNVSTRHVFRSADAGQTWIDVSGTGSTGLPDIPVNSLVLHPQDANVIYAGTDMGVFQGTFDPIGSTTTWGTLTNGLPRIAAIGRIALHPDSGIMRAFTYGRSTWEAQLLSPPNPDLKVNTTTGPVNAQSPRVSSGPGQNYAVAWIDNRTDARNTNTPHVYYRAYGYDTPGQPTALSTGNFRVDDDVVPHATQAVSLSADPVSPYASLCSRLMWSDNRVNGVNQHVFIGAMCSDGYKFFVTDIRADQHSPGINATNPGVAFQPNFNIAAVWQADRAVGSSLHDIYARFFDTYGSPKGSQFPVNIFAPPAGTYTDATMPTMASDSSGYVFVAWQESIKSLTTNLVVDSRVVIVKYDMDGSLASGWYRVDGGDASYDRYDPALTVDPSGNVIVAWWEWKRDATQRETVFYRRYSNALAVLDSMPVKVDTPPLTPPGAQSARSPSVATDASNNFAIAWLANVNAPAGTSWNAFAKGFSASGTILKNDFRVDLSGRSNGGPPRVARVRRECVGGANQNLACSSDANCPGSTCGNRRFAFAWRDNRSNSSYFDVYTRVVPSR